LHVGLAVLSGICPSDEEDSLSHSCFARLERSACLADTLSLTGGTLTLFSIVADTIVAVALGWLEVTLIKFYKRVTCLL
jgi:hypothetical protein